MNALEEEEFAEGECIVREGEIGHAFYILQTGEISVHKRRQEDGGDTEVVAGAGGGGGDTKNAQELEHSIGPQVGILRYYY